MAQRMQKQVPADRLWRGRQVRIVDGMQLGGKVLVTTLCDARALSKRDIKTLYQQRWDVELNLRHLKSTLGMHRLSAKTPDRNEKELWVYLLTSPRLADVLLRRLSFKHSVPRWLGWPTQSRPSDDSNQLM